MEEIWMPIEGFEGYYEVSNLGRVRSLDRIVNNSHNSIAHKKGRIISAAKSSRGYYMVSLQKDGKGKSMTVHRLVATAFLPNPDNLPQINHKDEDKSNNRVDNLEWCSRQYNVNYGTAIERGVKTKVKKGIIKEDHVGSSQKGRYKTLRDEMLSRQKEYYQKHRLERIEYQKRYNATHK